MSAFDVAVYTRGDAPVILPPGLTLRPVRWGATAEGGYDTAAVEAEGPEGALSHMANWLRYKVQIRGAGGLLWEGRVSEISLRLGNVTVTVSTEQLFNAINVIYSYTGDDGGGETGLTGWLVDDASANEYGRKDALHSAGGEITEEAAIAMRQTVLNACVAAASLPDVSTEGGGEFGATLNCTGAFQDLDWRYYEDATGYESHEETGGGRVLLGWSYTASTMGFVGAPVNRLFDMAGKLTPLEEADQVKVSGSSSNNGGKAISAAVAGETQSYTATTIGFDPTDDILDSALGLGFIRTKEIIRVTGSPNNDGYYYIGEVAGPDRVEASGGYGALPIQSDSAGPSVTIAMGHSVETSTALASEIPGASVTLAAYGQMVAQGFEVVNGPWQAGEVAIHIAKHGTPTDNIVVEIRSDNGSGLPGTVIASGTLDNALVPPVTRGWRSVQMTPPVTLSNGTPYWVNVRRLGAAHVDNYFSVSLDPEATYERGELRLYDGATWQARATAAHMPFKVWGTLDTTAKIQEIVTTCGGSVTGVYAQTPAGVRTRKPRDGRTTAGEEVRQLMKIGDSLGRRMLAAVREGGTLVLDFEEAAESAPMTWRRDGKLQRADGGLLPAGVLPVGRWVRVDQLVSGDWQVGAQQFLVGSAEYDAGNEAWSLRRLGARDPFDIGAQQA